MPSESPCLSKMLLGPYHSRTHQPWTTPSVTAASTHTVSIPGSVGSLREEATATTAFFEIPAISLLGAELLPLPGNPWICDIWQLREDPQHWSQAIANACLSAAPYLVSCAVFSPARSSVVYRRHEFLGKSLGLCTFGFLPVWECASAFTTWRRSRGNPHHLSSAWQIRLPSLYPPWQELPSLCGPPFEQHIGSIGTPQWRRRPCASKLGCRREGTRGP